MSPSGLIQAALVFIWVMLRLLTTLSSYIIFHTIRMQTPSWRRAQCHTVYYKKKRVSFASIIKHDINNGLRTLFLSFGFVCDVFVGALSLSLSARVIAQPAAAESKQISLLDMREL